MSSLVDKAIASDDAKSAFEAGWSIDQIRDVICVECGKVDVPAYGTSVVRSGRKIGYRRNGARYDAGHICGDCMNP